jgi:urea transport system ATP-binding protein
MSFVRQIANKSTVLHQGKKLAEGSVREIEDNPRVAEVYLGRAKISGAP